MSSQSCNCTGGVKYLFTCFFNTDDEWHLDSLIEPLLLLLHVAASAASLDDADDVDDDVMVGPLLGGFDCDATAAVVVIIASVVIGVAAVVLLIILILFTAPDYFLLFEKLCVRGAECAIFHT